RDANPSPKALGLEETSGKINYLIGNDPKRWRKGLSAYGKVEMQDVYPGINLVYYGNQRQIEFDFVVSPGADPKRIRMELDGAERLSVTPEGDLVADTGAGEVRWRRPVAYQQKNGSRTEIGVRYVIQGANRVGVEMARYDLNTKLVIDPVLEFSTLVGSNGTDAARGVKLDAAGNIYVTGYANSVELPTVGGLAGGDNGLNDAFVTKMNSTGTGLIYSTYVGGTGDDWAYGIALDASNNAYVVGETLSLNFPAVNAAQGTNGGSYDAFVFKLNPAGDTLLFSTYLGGAGEERGRAIGVNPTDNS